MLRVALISEEYPPFTFGGIGAVCYDLANSLSRKGVETTVFCGKSQRITVERQSEKLRVVRMPSLDLPPSHVWFQLRNLRAFQRLLKGYDIVHIVDPQAGGAAAHIERGIGKPLITSLHGLPESEARLFLGSPLADWTPEDFTYSVLEYPVNNLIIGTCLSNSDHAVLCSHALRREAERIYRTRCPLTVIPNGIDFDKMSRFRGIAGHSAARMEPSIVYYGRLYWRKGIMHLIDATLHLKEDFHTVKLEIFGRGPLERTIRRRVAELKLEDSIIVRGHVGYNELMRAVTLSDVVALPSLYEAQSVAMLEAMALRKALVAFDLPFSREIVVNGQNGLLARAGDTEDLAGKIGKLLSDGQLRFRMGDNAFQYVADNHDWSAIVEKYITLYGSCLDRNESAR
jgi:glycosyltransferase involved in cell wall biosynthesis